MRVFVLGGTGAIGRHAVRALVEAGHEIAAAARSPEKAAWVSSQGARPVHVSIFDGPGLRTAIEGFDAVVNLATAIPPTSKFMLRSAWTANDRVRTEGSSTLVDAALATGVPRLVQESVSMLYRDGGDEWVDEGCPTDDFPMARGNHAAEANANRFSEAGRVGVVLRLGWFYGPGAAHSEEFFALARRHVCVMMGAPHGFLSSIHVADGGSAVEAALRVPAGTYNVVDDEPLTKRAYADALAAAARVRPWLRAPGRLGHLLGHRTTSLTRSLRVRNARFRQASGWAPTYRSAREGWAATAEALGKP